MITECSDGLSASLEDYLEVIFHLEQANRVARAKDIADQMRVQRASVTGALKALASRGLINYSPYSFVTLTDAGRKVGGEVIRRHEALKEFFVTVLQLGPERAEANACRIEHAIDPEVIDKLLCFIDFIKNCPRAGADLFDAFSRFCRQQNLASDCENCLKKCIDRISFKPEDKK